MQQRLQRLVSAVAAGNMGPALSQKAAACQRSLDDLAVQLQAIASKMAELSAAPRPFIGAARAVRVGGPCLAGHGQHGCRPLHVRCGHESAARVEGACAQGCPRSHGPFYRREIYPPPPPPPSWPAVEKFQSPSGG